MSAEPESGQTSIPTEQGPAWDRLARSLGPPSPLILLRNRIPSVASSHSIFGVPLSSV
jgi:hypothetical protein